ncbi:MAG: hypothetical protein GY710_20430 [Desulfobacteraceae bacterium]|nr:hypothetical protein [Desulfobacteraceae bacterium]
MQDFYQLKRDNNPLREDGFTLSCLGKLHPASSSDFTRCGGWLSKLLDQILSSNFIEDEILIIGLTESGIIPAFLMYVQSQKKLLNTHIIYSTRRPMSGIAFNESHSHGPNHILPLVDFNFKEIWIVEDEITSGNTVFNLILQLSSYLKIDRARVFAFADFRSLPQRADFISKMAQKDIDCSVHIPPFQPGTGKVAIPGQPLVLNNIATYVDCLVKQSFKKDTDNWHLPVKRPGLGVKSDLLLDLDQWLVPLEWSCGTILAVGESVDLAACFALANKNLSFQQISLSPWKIDNKSVFSRMTFADKYYLYNYEKLKGSVFIICDPIDKDIEIEIIEKLKVHGIHVKPFFTHHEDCSSTISALEEYESF